MSRRVCSEMECAFEAVAAASKARTMTELERGVGPALARLGFERFGGVDVQPQPRRAHHVRHAFGAPLTEWVDHCKARGLAGADPMHDEVTRSTEPFLWSELAARRGGLSPAERAVMLSAGDFGMRDALTIPDHRPGGSVGAVHLIATAADPCTPQRRTAAHLIGVYYAAGARRLAARTAGRDKAAIAAPLSARQVECLKWVREGKSSTDIAAILKLSRRTVEDHIASACVRLGVRTRVQAVAVALMQGTLAGLLTLMAQTSLALDAETNGAAGLDWAVALIG